MRFLFDLRKQIITGYRWLNEFLFIRELRSKRANVNFLINTYQILLNNLRVYLFERYDTVGSNIWARGQIIYTE